MTAEGGGLPLHPYTLVVRPSPEDCAVVAASIVEQAVTRRARPVLGVATGSTPLPTYAALARRGFCVPALHLALLDEYVGVPPADPRTFTNTIRRHLAQPLGVPRGHVLAPPNRARGAAARCRRFERRLRDLGGVDLQILGLGRNGHIGFNEPGSSFQSRTRMVELAEATRRDNRGAFGGEDDVPRRACTQGVATILEARQLLLLVTGAHKAPILHAALTGPVTPDVPGSAMRLHPNVVVVADAAAAGTTVRSAPKEGSG